MIFNELALCLKNKVLFCIFMQLFLKKVWIVLNFDIYLYIKIKQ